jgi:tetratricopeptide (TPR) repeat protein
MKFFVLLFLIGVIAGAIYFILRKRRKIALAVAGIIGIVLTCLLIIVVHRADTAPDTWCSNFQNSTSFPPAELKTSTDYFEKGNYDYDTGNCKQAITDYTKSIEMNFKYPQAYNNRAYTYMRMRDYKDALTDLNKALELNPNYVNGLMNRGDIHNYYFEMDKAAAIADYEKIISIAGTKGTSVCGHLFLAQHNGWNLGTILAMPFEVMNCRGGNN